jgi:hypothetical protein
MKGTFLCTSILKIFIGGILLRDFFPSGITDCTKQIIDSNWPLCNESPINIILLSLNICNNFKGSNLKSRSIRSLVILSNVFEFLIS